MSTSKPSISAQPAQNFKPKSEWKHQDDTSYLYIYLPAFPLEQFTITPDYSNRKVRVEGKRRLPNSRFSPVDETFSIPEDCKLSKMEKQLGRGVLILKMPRNIVIPQHVTQQETVKETREETPEPKETVGEPMTRKDETSATGLEKKSLDKAAINRPVTTMKEESAEANGKPGKQESLVRNDGVKEEENIAQSTEMKGSAMTSAMSVAKIEDKGGEKEKSPKSADGGGKEAEKENANASAKKGMVKEMNEDRKLLVNMGAAVLIIMVLVVTLFYTLSNKPVS